MKVDVLTVNDVEFGRFRWWSNWIDVAVFDFAREGYLLQMKISRTNAKRFKCVPMASLSPPYVHASVEVAGDLVAMKSDGVKR